MRAGLGQIGTGILIAVVGGLVGGWAQERYFSDIDKAQFEYQRSQDAAKFAYLLASESRTRADKAVELAQAGPDRKPREARRRLRAAVRVRRTADRHFVARRWNRARARYEEIVTGLRIGCSDFSESFCREVPPEGGGFPSLPFLPF